MLLSEFQIKEILNFWFPNDQYNKFWFDRSESVDKIITERFSGLLKETYQKLISMDLNELLDMNYFELLAVIILLDQFSRNINRTVHVDVKSYTYKARKISYVLINNKYFLHDTIGHIIFILMPLRHMNELKDYELILDILNKLNAYKGNKIYDKFRMQTVLRYNVLVKIAG